MSVWVDAWGDRVDACVHPHADRFYRFLRDQADGIARLVGCWRRDDGAEAIVFRLQTGIPQNPAYAVHREEELALLFDDDGIRAPTLMALRADFPDTPHQNLVPEGAPCSLCVDDRPWIDVRPTWTAGEQLRRILRWFARAGDGAFTDPGQPLDPLYLGAACNIVVPRSAFFEAGVELIAMLGDEQSRIIIAEPFDPSRHVSGFGLLVVALRIAPAASTRLRRFPGTLLSLMQVVGERGVDLAQLITDRLPGCGDTADLDRFRLASKLTIVVQMPTSVPGLPVRMDTYAFVTEASVGEIGVMLGIYLQFRDLNAEMCFVRRIGASDPPNSPAFGQVEILPAIVHVEFDQTLAAQLSGRLSPDERTAVLIGAGAIGSHVAETLGREGRFRWTIVDPDTLLPHNLARHTLDGQSVGRKKAAAVAGRFEAIVQEAVQALDVDVIHPGGLTTTLEACLTSADVVIDAAASVPVSRRLSDGAAPGRIASVFFNPAGTDVVLLATGPKGPWNLRALEAAYYRSILRQPSLTDHLAQSATLVPYAGACRAVTNRIPSWRVQTLSGLVAGRLGIVLDGDDAVGAVWQLSLDGAVNVEELDLGDLDVRHVGPWTVTMPVSVSCRMKAWRTQRLPAETGGAILGIIDIAAHRFDVVEALGQPPDSVGDPGSFVRGTEGLRAQVERVSALTLGQVRYLGEWHSHPTSYPTTPSSIDLTQLALLTEALAADDCPALMMIVGDGNDLGVSVGSVDHLC